MDSKKSANIPRIRLRNTSWIAVGVLLLGLLLLDTCQRSQVDGKYESTWESLKQHPVPEWFDDAKFGIFIHWGVYSVPGWAPLDQYRYAEHYPQFMYKWWTPTYEYHKSHYGDPSEFGYKDFIPMFTAEHWDPHQWAELFQKAGARYVLPVAEHHDGFAMWDSDLTEWDAAEKGPKRDIIGELEQAVRARGMKYGVSYHRARHWWFFFRNKGEYDVSTAKYAGLKARIF